MAPERSALIVDDGELDTARGVLAELDVRIDHVRGEPRAEDLEPPYDLILSTARRAPALAAVFGPLESGELPGAEPGRVKTSWVAVHSQDFLPLRDRLRQLGVDYLVVSSVDDEVLRLLFLHALYVGPERRAQARLPVGAEISYEVRHNDGSAQLLDLTREGCRVVGAAPVGAGMHIGLRFPSGLSSGREVDVRGRIVRVERSAAGEPLAAIRFQDPDARALAAIDSILGGEALGTRVTLLAAGFERSLAAPAPASPGELETTAPKPASAAASPAAVESFDATRPASEDAIASARLMEAPAAAPLPPPAACAETAENVDFDDLDMSASTRELASPPSEAPTILGIPRTPGSDAPEPPAPDDGEDTQPGGESEIVLECIDRRSPRAQYTKSVTVQTGGATLVMLGRDLSLGGMRVAPTPGLGVGSTLRLTIFGGARQRPVVLPATVRQDDGEDGLLLRFAPLKRPEQERLRAIIEAAPAVEALGAGGAGGRIFISRSDIRSVSPLEIVSARKPAPAAAAVAEPAKAPPAAAAPAAQKAAPAAAKAVPAAEKPAPAARPKPVAPPVPPKRAPAPPADAKRRAAAAPEPGAAPPKPSAPAAKPAVSRTPKPQDAARAPAKPAPRSPAPKPIEPATKPEDEQTAQGDAPSIFDAFDDFGDSGEL